MSKFQGKWLKKDKKKKIEKMVSKWKLEIPWLDWDGT